jgi:hypothetical protein
LSADFLQTLANESITPTDFPSLLRASLMRDSVSKATCPFCKRVVNLRSRRVFPPGSRARDALPSVIAINAAILTDDQLDIWRNKAASRATDQRRFLPDQVKIRMQDDGAFSVVARTVGAGGELAADDVVYRVKASRMGWRGTEQSGC